MSVNSLGKALYQKRRLVKAVNVEKLENSQEHSKRKSCKDLRTAKWRKKKRSEGKSRPPLKQAERTESTGTGRPEHDTRKTCLEGRGKSKRRNELVLTDTGGP